MPLIITLLGGLRATVFASLWVITLGGLAVQSQRFAHSQSLRQAEKVQEAQTAAAMAARWREAERRHAQALAMIGEQHEQERAAAQAVEAALLEQLRGGAVRLRRAWRCAQQPLPKSRATTGQRDAPAPDRDALAAAIVRAGRDADDQMKACHAVIKVMSVKQTD